MQVVNMTMVVDVIRNHALRVGSTESVVCAEACTECMFMAKIKKYAHNVINVKRTENNNKNRERERENHSASSPSSVILIVSTLLNGTFPSRYLYRSPIPTHVKIFLQIPLETKVQVCVHTFEFPSLR